MKQLYKSILLACGVFLCFTLHAKDNLQQEIKISGRIVSKVPLSKIYLGYSEYDWFTKADCEMLVKDLKTDGNFEFSLPDLNKPYRFTLVLRGIDGTTIWNANYYADSRDDVNFEINTDLDSIIFSGPGSEKYNVIYKIESIYNKECVPEMRLLKPEEIKDSIELSNKMQQLFSLFKENQEKMTNFIQASTISSEMKKIIRNEYIQFDLKWKSRTELLLRYNSKYKKQILTTYFLKENTFAKKPDSINRYCYSYWYFVSSINAFNLTYSGSADKIKIESFYKYIKDKYSGYARDRLISTCFFTSSTKFYFAPHSQTTVDSLLKDALTFVSVPYIKNAIQSEVNYTTKSKLGSKIYDPEFIGLDNKPFDIKSLKGKVFIIDGWFNGCTGCAKFHSYFEKYVYPKFKDNSDFVVLSINVDKNKDQWLKGIRSRLYTSNNYINITTGNWFDHPFTKYYGLTAAPFLIVVNAEGNISYKADATTVTAELLVDEIDKALKHKFNRIY